MGLFDQSTEQRRVQVQHLYFMGYSEPIEIESAAFGLGFPKGQIVSCEDCGTAVLVKPLEEGQEVEDVPIMKHAKYCQAITQEERYLRRAERYEQALRDEEETDDGVPDPDQQ